MWNEFFARLPCSVGLVRWAAGRFTIIVKVTLRVVRAQGSSPTQLVWSETPDPLGLDVVDGNGAVLHPSDFAPYKSACDVLVAGAEIGSRATEGLIAIGRAEKRVAANASLGARETFCPGGDPTDPAALRVWSQPNADFSRFQHAPPDQRIAHPRSPFAVQYRRADVAIDARFDGGEPTVRLLDRASQGPVAAIPMALDTILVAPREERVSLVWRGVAAWPQGAPILAVDFDGPGVPPSYVFAGKVVEPQALRAPRPSMAPEQTVPDDTRLVDPGAAHRAALPFGPPSSRPAGTRLMVSLPSLVASAPVAGAANVAVTQLAPAHAADAAPAEHASASTPPSSGSRTQLAPAIDAGQTVPATRVKALTLPFRRVGAAPPSEPRGALDARGFAELRGGPAVAAAWDAAPGTSAARPQPMTQALTALPLEESTTADVPPPPLASDGASYPTSAAPPPPSAYPQIASYTRPQSYAPAPPPPPVAPPPVVSHAPLPSSQMPPPPPPPPAPAAPASPSPSPPGAPSEDVMKAIQREVWKGERPLADILKDHGVTETGWREAKRTRGKS